MKHQLSLKIRGYRFKRFCRKAYSVFNSMHKIVSIGVVNAAVLTFAHTTQASVSNVLTTARDSIPEQELEEVIVTASRIDLATNQAANLVTVITKEEIEQSPAKSVQDLLNYLPTIDIQQRGAFGIQADVSLRGGSFDQTAFLLNGMNLSNPQTGHYSLDIPVNLSDIERIEIIHGPASLAYGANALSGGINIITKKKQESAFSASLEGGSHDMLNVETSGSLPLGNISNRLSLGYKTSNGYIADSDYDIYGASWQSGFQSGESKMNIQLGYNNKNYGANTFYSPKYPHQYEETSSYFVGINGETGTKLKIIPRLYWNRHDDCFQLNRGEVSPIPYNYHRSDVFGIAVNMQYSWNTGITSVGADLRNEGILSSVLGKPMLQPEGHYSYSDNRTDINYFLEHDILLSDFSLSFGILAHRNSALVSEQFGVFPVANIAYRITPSWKIYAAWKNATRMPTFTDLFYNTVTHAGNPNLLPEKSTSMELGLKYTTDFVHLFVTGYYMNGTNLIDWAFNESTQKWQSQNLGKIHKTGIESEATFYLRKLAPKLHNTVLKLGLTHLSQKSDESGKMISAYVLNYLRNKFTAQLSHPVYKTLTAAWNFRWQDREGVFEKYTGGILVGEAPYPAYSVLDFKLIYPFRAFKFHLSVNNVFNTVYYDLGNLPQPGFWLNVGVGYAL